MWVIWVTLSKNLWLVKAHFGHLQNLSMILPTLHPFFTRKGPAQFWQSGWGAFLAIANLSTKSESERALFSVLLFSWQALWANFLKRAQLHCWGTFTQYSFWLSWQPLRGVKKALHCAVFQALRITMAQWWWVHQLFKRYNTIMTSSEIWQKCHFGLYHR